MKKDLLLSLFFTFCTSTLIVAQVQKQIILEHFTNTKCSVCASKNPGLNTNLQNHPEVIRISYHPSSPYNTCVFNQHNVSGNDGRTNQYGIYGATPRLVIQGEVISPNQNFAATDLFDNYIGELSPVLLNCYIDSITLDSSYVSVVAKTVSTLANSNVLLYVALAEDTIAYSAPNGEQSHYGVFRRSLNGNQGQSITLSSTIGDSVVFTYATKNHVDWNLSNLEVITTLQNNSDLSVVQSAISGLSYINNSSVEEQEGDEGFDIHFNSSTQQLTIYKENCGDFKSYEIYDINGRLVNTGSLSGNLSYINLVSMPQGVFLIRLLSMNDFNVSKAVKFIK